MNLSELSQIEKNIDHLTRLEQFYLVESIIRRWRQDDAKENSIIENQLSKMAKDVEIQNELHKINEEFIFTETDGLNIK